MLAVVTHLEHIEDAVSALALAWAPRNDTFKICLQGAVGRATVSRGGVAVVAGLTVANHAVTTGLTQSAVAIAAAVLSGVRGDTCVTCFVVGLQDTVAASFLPGAGGSAGIVGPAVDAVVTVFTWVNEFVSA